MKWHFAKTGVLPEEYQYPFEAEVKGWVCRYIDENSFREFKEKLNEEPEANHDLHPTPWLGCGVRGFGLRTSSPEHGPVVQVVVGQDRSRVLGDV